MASSSLVILSFLLSTLGFASALAAAATPMRSYLITGANKGQGYALCKRILSEYGDTHVYLCSRDVQRGREAKESLLTDIGCDIHSDRIDVLQLDVTSDTSVQDAMNTVRLNLGPEDKLAGVVSNAGILWGYPLPELMEVCAVGVRRVLDAFVPLCQEEDGRVVVVTSGLGPLMHSYASEEHQNALKSDDCTWDDTISPLITKCISAYETTESSLEERIAAFDKISFPGGPFSDSAPDFHMYGLAKMFGDAYMLHVAKNYPKLRVTSVDPGLVYTDLILKMPKYAGKEIGDTTAQTPEEGVEATMRLLFDDEAGKGEDGSGKLYAMKDGKLVFSDIDKMPQKQ
mmetsp:Transcript_28317/g.48151  ORF Transcript_28317/g.48151 Transcript_28317/m.48151 type:complete len:343 (-) Transcript_28317:1228-2256(-)